MGVDIVVVPVTETAFALLIPRMLLAVIILKHPTYTPAVVFIGTAKHESPPPHVVSLYVPAVPQFPVEPLTQAMEPDVQVEDAVKDKKSAL